MPTVEDILRECLLLSESSRHDEAIELLTPVVEQTPDDRLYFRRARHFEHLGDSERAVQDYTRAIELKPTNPRYYYDRGMVSELDLGRRTEAIQDYITATDLAPNFVEAHQQCCLSMLLRTGLLEYAREHALAAVRLAPEDGMSHYCLGEVSICANEPALAAESFARAVDLEPEYANHWRALGRALGRTDDPDQLPAAVNAYTRVITLEPDDGDAYADRGAVRVRAGMLTTGIADLRHALSYGLSDFKRTLTERRLAEAEALLGDVPPEPTPHAGGTPTTVPITNVGEES
jgi:tetratricopeptide (TPR) repeat protein